MLFKADGCDALSHVVESESDRKCDVDGKRALVQMMIQIRSAAPNPNLAFWFM